jgi:hypothetical protein
MPPTPGSMPSFASFSGPDQVYSFTHQSARPSVNTAKARSTGPGTRTVLRTEYLVESCRTSEAFVVSCPIGPDDTGCCRAVHLSQRRAVDPCDER